MFTLLWAQRPGSGRVSLRRFPADADDARPAVRGTTTTTSKRVGVFTLLWAQRPGSGRVSLRRFPADADDAPPAVSAIRPMTELSGGAPVML